MPRGPRLDAPGALHHVIARGIERRRIFEDDADRNDFLDRLCSLVLDGALAVYAWALMPNHFHLLVRTGKQPLERSMRALLAGYATRFNRRHDRVGHLFQNRYRSTLCEDEPYFLTLVRYIHRNPIPSVIEDLDALGRYPYTGHPTLLGAVPRPWQDTGEVLQRFGREEGQAIKKYLEFMREVDHSTQGTDLDGGGLKRSRLVWRPVARLERGRERFRSDERILGREQFAQRVLQDIQQGPPPQTELDTLIARVCRAVGIDTEAVRSRGRAAVVCRAREGIAYLWTRRLGGSNRDLARHLGLAESPLHRAAQRGARDFARWDPLLKTPAL